MTTEHLPAGERAAEPADVAEPAHREDARQVTARRPPNRLARDAGYLVSGLPLGIVGFAVAVVGFTAGVGTFIVVLGILVLAGTLRAARGMARVERRRVQWLTGTALPPHHYREPRGRGLGRIFRGLAEPQSWRDLLHMVLVFPLRIGGFVLTVAGYIGGFGALLYILWEWRLPKEGNSGLAEIVFGWSSRAADIGVHTAAGGLLLVLTPLLVRGITVVHVGLARALLTNQAAALRARTRQLAEGRRAAVQAEAQTLRRVERDIHDGPQQRLVRLTMDLESAQRRMDTDPAQARSLVAEALEQTTEALAELRALSRGIAPPILLDRGLAAALSAAAARCPVPVSLQVKVPEAETERLPAVVEQTAYYVVTEALTNVAKHAQASGCTVTLRPEGDDLVVRVTDDGVGGAHTGKGHGLAGIADRLSTVEGRLEIDSPVGGPTLLHARIPRRGIERDG